MLRKVFYLPIPTVSTGPAGISSPAPSPASACSIGHQLSARVHIPVAKFSYYSTLTFPIAIESSVCVPRSSASAPSVALLGHCHRSIALPACAPCAHHHSAWVQTGLAPSMGQRKRRHTQGADSTLRRAPGRWMHRPNAPKSHTRPACTWPSSMNTIFLPNINDATAPPLARRRSLHRPHPQ